MPATREAPSSNRHHPIAQEGRQWRKGTDAQAKTSRLSLPAAKPSFLAQLKQAAPKDAERQVTLQKVREWREENLAAGAWEVDQRSGNGSFPPAFEELVDPAFLDENPTDSFDESDRDWSAHRSQWITEGDVDMNSRMPWNFVPSDDESPGPL